MSDRFHEFVEAGEEIARLKRLLHDKDAEILVCERSLSTLREMLDRMANKIMEQAGVMKTALHDETVVLAAIQNSELDCCAWHGSVQARLAREIVEALTKAST